MASLARRLPRRLVRHDIPIYPFWRTVTYLSALVTFAALLGTGEISPVVTILFFAAWLVGYFVPEPPRWWRGWMGQALTIGAVFVLGGIARRGEYFESVLYLLLFLVVAKCYTLKTSRDYLQAQLLCFFTLLSTAVITVAFYFLLVFVCYLFLAALGLSLYSVARQRDRALAAQGGERREAGQGAIAEALPRRFLRGGAAAMLMLLLWIAFFFIFIPHVSINQYSAPLSRRDAPPERLTGFSEEMAFGEFKRLRPNQQIVMRIELSWPDGIPKTRSDQLYLRGMAMDYYDETSWRRSPSHARPVSENSQQISLAIKSAQKGRSASRNTKLTIYQDTDVTTRIFAAPIPILVDLGRRLNVKVDKDLGGAQIVAFGRTREQAYTNPLDYEVNCNVVDEASAFLPQLIEADQQASAVRAATLLNALGPGDQMEEAFEAARDAVKRPKRLGWISLGKRLFMTPEERLINTQLPDTDLTRKIESLAREVAPSAYAPQAILDLSRFFHKEFAYSFEPGIPPGRNPIEAFLFETRKGHCEYFATAFVLMLRARGIPARIVNGFFTTEWNPMAERFIVRQADAHSWAEVWVDGPGWLLLDPTPPGSAGRAPYGLGPTSIAEVWSEYLRTQWQRFVIDYSSNKQVMILERVRSMPGFRALFSALDYAREKVASSNRRPTPPDRRPPSDLRSHTADVFLLAAALSLIFIAARRYIRRSRLGRSRSGIDYFDAALALLERRGLRRPPPQTPADFFASAAYPPDLAPDLQWLVSLYYRHKYSSLPPSPDERRRALSILARLKASPSPRRA